MTPVTSKICVVGDFAVGKTSVVEQFVNNHFSEKYLSTVGVKIDTREVQQEDLNLTHKLVIWDVAGTDTFGDREFGYLRGASGLIFVADGTRTLTLDAASALRAQTDERFGVLPAVLLLNKHDLKTDWAVREDHVNTLEPRFDQVVFTSAKTGENVAAAMQQLSGLIIARDMQA
ncbi:MAG: GTP-binding protein [Pseudomonadota bacterium]